MIKVNLVGAARKKGAKAGGPKLAMPASATPFLLGAIVLGFAGGGYYWWSSLSSQLADLDSRIQQAEAQKKTLENVIKQDSIFESRKKTLENRVKVIEGLQRNQVSPVIALDALGQAVDNTEYVWLSSLNQNNAVFDMNGQGTSYEAVAKFIDNLEQSGYFINVDTPGAQQSGSLYTFTLRCEFAPRNPAPLTPSAAPAAGGN